MIQFSDAFVRIQASMRHDVMMPTLSSLATPEIVNNNHYRDNKVGIIFIFAGQNFACSYLSLFY